MTQGKLFMFLAGWNFFAAFAGWTLGYNPWHTVLDVLLGIGAFVYGWRAK